MASSRKSAAQKRAEQVERRHDAWSDFYRDLSQATTLEAVRQLQDRRPAPNSPGRPYYSNLDFFMGELTPPFGASSVELIEYRRLVGCFAEEGRLKDGALEPIQEALTKAIEQRPF